MLGDQGLGTAVETARHVIIVVQIGSRIVGLLVDAVSEVVDIPAGQIEPPPSFGTAVRRDFIQGMGKLGERFVIILAPDKAFDVDDMARLCEATQESAAV